MILPQAVSFQIFQNIGDDEEILRPGLDHRRSGKENVEKILKSENQLKEVKRKLIFSKIENDSLNTYIAITKNFLQGIFETVVPQRRNTLYSRTGNIVRPVPESMLINTLG